MEAAICYSMNHSQTHIIIRDIREVTISDIRKLLGSKSIDLLAGCPPCQGFSSVRRLNRKRSARDPRNNLILDYLRFVKALRPKTIMLENVPALQDYYLFKSLVKSLQELGYKIDHGIVNVADYGVPQRRKRLVLVGSLLGPIVIAPSPNLRKTVRDIIGDMESIEKTADPIHKIVAKHKLHIEAMIKMIPHDGGSRTNLPEKHKLECHKKLNVGFNDIYGRLKWDDVSSTITGGCLNPSKGRFLHPEQDRAITAREAALLQTFSKDYRFPTNLSKDKLALLIGNALPPEFSRIQSSNILSHLKKYHG